MSIPAAAVYSSVPSSSSASCSSSCSVSSTSTLPKPKQKKSKRCAFVSDSSEVESESSGEELARILEAALSDEEYKAGGDGDSSDSEKDGGYSMKGGSSSESGGQGSDVGGSGSDEPLVNPPQACVYFIAGVLARRSSRIGVSYKVQWKQKGQQDYNKNTEWVTRENFGDGSENGSWVVGFGGEGLTREQVLTEMTTLDEKSRPKKQKQRKKPQSR